MTICHIPSSDNTADVFTKHIPPELFIKHRLGMGIKDPPGVVIRELPAPDPVHKPGKLDQPEDFITSDKVGHVVVKKSCLKHLPSAVPAASATAKSKAVTWADKVKQ